MHSHRHVLEDAIIGAGGKVFLSNTQDSAIKFGRVRPKRPRRDDSPLAVADESPYDARPGFFHDRARQKPRRFLAAARDPWSPLGADPMYVSTIFRAPIFNDLPTSAACGHCRRPTYHCGAGTVGSPMDMKKL